MNKKVKILFINNLLKLISILSTRIFTGKVENNLGKFLLEYGC